MKSEIIRLENVTRLEKGVKHLDNFNMRIYKGEILGLLPLNTQGVSALIEIICQNAGFSRGHFYFNNIPQTGYEPDAHVKRRAAVIEKKSALAGNLTVADNIFVLRYNFNTYVIDNKILNNQVLELSRGLDISIDPKRPAGELSDMERCVVELIKAVAGGAALVILKNPGDFLSAAELSVFHKTLLHYKEKGISFLYICGQHEETFSISERVLLMENGCVVKILDKREFTKEKINAHLYGFGALEIPKTEIVPQNEMLLEFRNVVTKNLKGFSFYLKKGECLVILDLANTALADIVMLMNGEIVPAGGVIELDGAAYGKKRTLNALAEGVAFISETPADTMIFPEMSCLDNLCFLVEEKRPKIRLSGRVKKSISKEYGKFLGDDIHEQNVSALSAASIYNIVYYRIHLLKPKVVFCIQPFSGVNMEHRRQVIGLINSLKERGIAVVILAISLSDALIVGNRLLLMHNGQEYAEFEQDFFDGLYSRTKTFSTDLRGFLP